jgi:hypothetical protein
MADEQIAAAKDVVEATCALNPTVSEAFAIGLKIILDETINEMSKRADDVNLSARSSASRSLTAPLRPNSV